MKCSDVIANLECSDRVEIDDLLSQELSAHLRNCSCCRADAKRLLTSNDQSTGHWQLIIRAIHQPVRLAAPEINLTLLKQRSFLSNFITELTESGEEFIDDPRQFLKDLWRGELGSPRPNLPVGIRIAIFIWLFSLCGGAGWYFRYGWGWHYGNGFSDRSDLVMLTYLDPKPAPQWLHGPLPKYLPNNNRSTVSVNASPNLPTRKPSLNSRMFTIAGNYNEAASLMAGQLGSLNAAPRAGLAHNPAATRPGLAGVPNGNLNHLGFTPAVKSEIKLSDDDDDEEDDDEMPTAFGNGQNLTAGSGATAQAGVAMQHGTLGPAIVSDSRFIGASPSNGRFNQTGRITAKPDGTVQISTRVLNSSYSVGQTGLFGIILQPTNAVIKGIQINIHYNPKVIKITATKDGGLFSQDGLIRECKFSQTEGLITISNNIPGGLSTGNQLALIYFQVIGKGSAALELGEVVLSLPDNQAYPITLSNQSFFAQ